MRLLRCSAILFLALASTKLARAQSYYDVLVDGYEVIVDDFADATEGSGSCPSGVYINDNLNGDIGETTVYYPHTAEVTVSTAASPGVNYPWTRTVELLGMQRGGKCGSISLLVITRYTGFAVTFTQSASVMSNATGECAQVNACTNGSPLCPVSSILEGVGKVVPCPVWFETLTVVINGACDLHVSSTGTGPGVCTLP